MQLLVVALLLSASPVTDRLPVEVVRVNPIQAKRVAIVSQETSIDRQTLYVTLKPKDKQFTADFKLTATNFRKVVIKVHDVKDWESVRYFPDKERGKHFADLMKTRGVVISRSGSDAVIEFISPDSVKILPPGGRLQFHQTYDSTASASR